MPTPAFRVTEAFYAKIKVAAKAKNTSVSNFIRSCVEYVIDNDLQPSKPVDPLSIEILQEQLKADHKQLAQKDDQISELHQLLGMAQKNVGTLTDQLTHAHAQLEDLRKPRPWWQRVFGRVT